MKTLLTVTLILALTLIIVGTSVTFAGSEWVVFTGVALFLLAGMPVVGQLSGGSPTGERKKISYGLVALSSAAIIAVYAAGYTHTEAAADQFEQQAAAPRRRANPMPAGGNSTRPAPPAAIRPSEIIPAIDGQVAVVAPEPSTAPIPATAPAPAQPEAPVAGSAVAAAPAPEAAPVAVAAAPAPAAAPTAVAAAAPVSEKAPDWQYVDGAYWGWGSCRHGDIQVQVVVENGWIAKAGITKCETRYPCSMIDKIPPQVVAFQDPDRIDNVSGATDSVDAYYDAVIDALNKSIKYNK